MALGRYVVDAVLLEGRSPTEIAKARQRAARRHHRRYDGPAPAEGINGTAIGLSGLAPLRHLAVAVDPSGLQLASTVVAVAD
jgi:hypothetical protein